MQPREFTLRAVTIGAILVVVMTGANAYLGLYAGMTVSASIPAAVISMAVLRIFRRKGESTILESNLGQTMASAGESLAAGIIFTMPALLIVDPNAELGFWQTTLIAFLGGTVGILVMIFFRRAFIVNAKELGWPEAVAGAKVLKAGEADGEGNEEDGTGVSTILTALVIGAVYKFFVSGVEIIKGKVGFAFSIGKSVFGVTANLSVALLSVGYIVGANVAILVFIGGAIAWLVAIPVYTFFVSVEGPSALDVAWKVWETQIRYLGVGAMVIAGIATIIETFFNIRSSFKKGSDDPGHTKSLERTDQDMKLKHILLILIPITAAIFFFYMNYVGSVKVALVMWLVSIIASVFFVAVSSYIVGLVGGSSNPVSGMTICSILLICIILVAMKVTGDVGIVAALSLAGVICCAACTAGDISQDLKTGHIVGATPKNQQWAQLIAIIIAAPLLAPILTVLHKAYTIGSPVLQAPQAKLFASIAQGFFGDGNIPWSMVYGGMGLGGAFILANLWLKHSKYSIRSHPMAIAIGIYLPIGMSIPIAIGGLISLITKRLGEKAELRGTLYASGLIAGEALIGILLAIMFVLEMDPIAVTSVAIFAAIGYMLWRKVRDHSANEAKEEEQ